MDGNIRSTRADIHAAELSLACNTFPSETAAQARAALQLARRALAEDDRVTALAAADTAVALLAGALASGGTA
ncbi:hypothetical protein [Streptomyces xanthophaeus]|uniref:hypothetical protein n=1 Tax=Streptomyces xanthophaeus TaxID=67385 RepID=UPI0004CDB92B|nr:hypothetical protein [Streptomyces xanthophaeus]